MEILRTLFPEHKHKVDEIAEEKAAEKAAERAESSEQARAVAAAAGDAGGAGSAAGAGAQTAAAGAKPKNDDLVTLWLKPLPSYMSPRTGDVTLPSIKLSYIQLPASQPSGVLYKYVSDRLCEENKKLKRLGYDDIELRFQGSVVEKETTTLAHLASQRTYSVVFYRSLRDPSDGLYVDADPDAPDADADADDGSDHDDRGDEGDDDDAAMAEGGGDGGGDEDSAGAGGDEDNDGAGSDAVMAEAEAANDASPV